MKKNCFAELVLVILCGCLLTVCKAQSADAILASLETQITALEKLQKTIAANPENAFIESEKWQKRFMETLGKLEKYKGTMTAEQAARLNELFTKGSIIMEQLFN